jgi:hypothetical protein
MPSIADGDISLPIDMNRRSMNSLIVRPGPREESLRVGVGPFLGARPGPTRTDVVRAVTGPGAIEFGDVRPHQDIAGGFIGRGSLGAKPGQIPPANTMGERPSTGSTDFLRGVCPGSSASHVIGFRP